MKTKIARRHTSAYAIALATALLLLPGFYFFPAVGDDLMSVLFFKDSFIWGKPFDWATYLANVREIYFGLHFRLPQLLMPFMMLIPKWIPAVISSAAAGYLLVGGSRMGAFLRSWKAMVLYAAGIVLLFPWTDQMYLISFQVPYLWGAALSLMLLKMILAPGSANVWLAGILGFVTGFWMEAYAGAVFGACVCLAIFYKEYRIKTIYIVTASLACGILTAAIPLIVYDKWTNWPDFHGRMIMVYPYLAVIALHALMSVMMLRRHRREVVNSLNLTLLEVGIASAILTVSFEAGARICGFGVVCALIGVIRLARCMEWGRGLAASVAAVLLGAFAVCHLVVVDVLCYRMGKETDYVLDRYLHHGESPVFTQLTLREDAPLLALQKPYFDWFAHDRPLKVFEKIYGDGHRPIEVVPRSLQDFAPAKAELIEGSARLYYYDGYLVGADTTLWMFITDFGRGPSPCYYHKVAFDGNDRRRYLWLHPDNASVDFLLNKKPLRVDSIPE